MSSIVQIRFPVWRELKPTNNCLLQFGRLVVQIRFPVWRELKHTHRCSTSLHGLWFRYAFPFEGNWNHKFVHDGMFGTSSDTLSRLKGIETIALVAETQSGLLWFRYAFPFEGNWNTISSEAIRSDSSRVQIRFPVWRELKLFAGWLSGQPTVVQIRFPVWRELKHF